MSAEDRTLVTLTLGGIDCGTWETMTGRDTDSDGDAYRPGVGKAQKTFGGPKKYTDITVTRTYDSNLDLALYKRLNTLGSKAKGSCTETELDDDYNTFGKALTWPVRLKGIKRPGVNIDSGNRKMLEITMWVDGDPA